MLCCRRVILGKTDHRERRISFYDFDCVIQMSEERVQQYLSEYHTVQNGITHIILIYSAIGIYLVPIAQDLFTINSLIFRICAGFLGILLITSTYFTVRLILPKKLEHLKMVREYYDVLRNKYEREEIKPSMTDAQKTQAKLIINSALKASYIGELARAQEINYLALYANTSFYYRAIFWGLLAAIPYTSCIGYHIAEKNDQISKAELIKKS